jgi:hypothetical protein
MVRGFKVEHETYLSGHIANLPLFNVRKPKQTTFESSELLDKIQEDFYEQADSNYEFENTYGTLNTGEVQIGLYEPHQVEYQKNVGLKNKGYSKAGLKNFHFKKVLEES